MKTLLILGAFYTEIEIILRAKSLGYKTIVTDQYTDFRLSPAKTVADEAWNISWTDIDALCAKCKECHVDGVLAGFSEFRVESMIRLCERLGLCCSLTMEQLDITRNKNRFKRLCEHYSIPCVPEHRYEENFSFPVIVKPVDRAGSAGISVAYNREEFETAYQYAMSMSLSKQVIIEDFIRDGNKVDVYYYVKDGKITFLGSSDTILCHNSGVLQKAWPFPSKWESLYFEELDNNVRKMIAGIGITNAYLTISAFFHMGHLYVFETGFRLSGEMSFNYYKAISGINYLDEMIRYALNDSSDAQFREINNKNHYSVILNMFAENGIVKDIHNDCSVKEMNEVIGFVIYAQSGDEIHNTTQVLKKIAMCTLYSKNKEKLLDAVDTVNTIFSIENECGNEMIYERVSRSELDVFWN